MKNHKKSSFCSVYVEIRAFRRTVASLNKSSPFPHMAITFTTCWIGVQMFSHGKRASIATMKIAKSVLTSKLSYDIFARSRRYVLFELSVALFFGWALSLF